MLNLSIFYLMVNVLVSCLRICFLIHSLEDFRGFLQFLFRQMILELMVQAAVKTNFFLKHSKFSSYEIHSEAA